MIPRVLLVLGLLASASAGQGETVVARRMADIVAVRTQPDREERILYYFDPTAELGPGDELEQGVGGHSVIVLGGGGLVTLYGSAHIVLSELGTKRGDVIVFPDLTLGVIDAGERRIVVGLPGNNICVLQQTSIRVTAYPGRMVVRNEGGLPVEVLGPFDLERASDREDGLGRVVLQRGEEVGLPLFSRTPEGTGTVTERWGGLSLTHNGGFQLEVVGDALTVQASDDPQAPAGDELSLGGVRTRLGTGRLLVSNRRQPVVAALVQVSAPEPPAFVAPRPVPPPGTPPPREMDREQIISMLMLGQEQALRDKGYTITEELLAEAESRRQEAAAAAEAAGSGDTPEDDGGSDDQENNEP